MKKQYFVFIFYVLCCISAFGGTDTWEEVDFLLFSPNSGSRFENQEKALIQINSLAQYLMGKNLSPGQIIVYGYAAYAPNDIKSDDLSRERAGYVINELQKRGVSKELFSDPVGCGAVYLWGNNDTENARKLNRRVRVLLDNSIPVTHEIISEDVKEPVIQKPVIPKAVYSTPIIIDVAPQYTPRKANFKFPWWMLLLLAFLAAVFLFFILLGRRSRKSACITGAAAAQPKMAKTAIVTAPAMAVTTYTVNLDEEIRTRAYELSRQRNGLEDLREQDWYNAVREISAWYIACGHSVFTDGGCWWASSTVDNS